ncbi:MAG: efflux RND transporter periplasmic adaptor subunit [Thermodesulfobacteriota bacterium]|nr:efflux RND transporter periplasmic adaptor subunit [Thermodesulfobacteriota bacterium]
MKQKTSPSVFLRIFLCLLILGAGFAGFLVLKKMKKPPLQVEGQERALPVQVVQVQAELVPVTVSGYGEIKSRSMVPLSAEVAGRITSVHPDLQVGAVIKKGEILCTINDQDFRLEFATAQTRLQSLSRDLALARKEFARVSSLYKKNKVGTMSSVEKAERSVNGIVNQRVQVQQAIELAKLRLERCVIRAPFTGRITERNVEVNEYVTPGRKLLTIVDDADLEIEVSLDSRDGVNWLRFQSRRDSGSWFGLPEETGCTITWTEREEVQGKGRLDRVVRFDPATRTLVVAVRLKPGNTSSFPLVQGMFCRVDIVGRPLDKVFILPRRAVTYEGNVHVIRDSRLHTRKVEVARVQDDKALITGGLQEGETVIITRLENPLENALVRIEEAGDGG